MKKLLIVLLGFSSFAGAQQPAVSIIPAPLQMQTGTGSFVLSKNTVIAARDEADKKTAALLNDYLRQYYGLKLDVDRQESRDYIRLTTRKFIQAPAKDGYSLEVTSEGVTIEGDTYAGTFYGMQTLLQLLPAGGSTAAPGRNLRQKEGPPSGVRLTIPALLVNDAPRFSYRGMHLDVSRHFFGTDFVKSYIDLLAFHKLNYFHWHLTDDQGWRVEIKKYPELTSVGAWRDGTIIGRYPGTGNDNLRYGGFYTQEQVREIVRYAADRHITVVPEIEMPGHSSAAIAAYPWLSCFPEEETVIPSHPSLESQQKKGKKVQETWGVFSDIYCAGKDSTFQFLQDVLDEILPLFPSTYIHVGGDECPKVNWKKCPRCQARIKALGLKDEHELQSYFVQRIEKYLNGRGRTLIGWDEILEGGLAPNAVVMSWRGEKGGIEAARQSHQVIMTPQKPVYFDHTQTKNEDSVVIGGYNPLEAVYAYEPVPKELDSARAAYIRGAQANLWTEYIAYPSKVEYMVLPRMAALSEVLWSEKNKRSWDDFQPRLLQQLSRYDLQKRNYSRAYFDLKSNIVPVKGKAGIRWQLKKGGGKGFIQYQTPDGRTYQALGDSVEIPVEKPGSYKAWLAESSVQTAGELPANDASKALTKPMTQTFRFHKAAGQPVSITAPSNERYPGQSGAFSLVNGIYSAKGLTSADWLGWIGDNIEATIDLGKKMPLDSVRMHTLNQNGSWIYLPAIVEIWLSNDGKSFRSAGQAATFVPDTMNTGWINVPLQKGAAGRYIKLIARNYGLIPDGKPGAGNKAWIFADEIEAY